MPDTITDFRFVLMPDPTESGRTEIHFKEAAFMRACRLGDLPRVRSCTESSYSTTVTHYECQAIDARAVQERIMGTRASAQAQADRCADIRRKAAILAGTDRPWAMTACAALTHARLAATAAIQREAYVRDCWAGHPARQEMDEQDAADHVADCLQRVAAAEDRVRGAIEEARETLGDVLVDFPLPTRRSPFDRCTEGRGAAV